MVCRKRLPKKKPTKGVNSSPCPWSKEYEKHQTMHCTKYSNCKDSQALEQRGLQPITGGFFGWLVEEVATQLSVKSSFSVIRAKG